MALPKRKIGDEIKKKAEKLSLESEIDLNNLELNTLGNISAESLGILIKEEIKKDDKLEFVSDTLFIDNNYDDNFEMTKHPQFNIEYIDLSELGAAPSNWNLWEPHDSKTKAGLVEDILEIGMLQDIIVWKIPYEINIKYKLNKNYMILAGHNRTDAHRILYNVTQFDKFSKIRAKVYDVNEINLQLAKRMIDSTNLWSRVKTNKELGQAYLRDAKNIINRSGNKLSKNKVVAALVERDGKSRNFIYEKMDLANLIDDFDLIAGIMFNYKATLSLSKISHDNQKYIYDVYYLNEENRHLLTSTKLQKIKKLMSTSTIDDIMRTQNVIVDYIEKKYKIPLHLVEEFDKLAKSFLNSNNA